MRYFNTLPTIIKQDYNNNLVLASNLVTRAYLLPSLMKNVTLFYDYDIRDGDSPEIIAHKYYGNVYKYWIVLYSNQIIDPQSEWPLTSKQFEDYLTDKYTVSANGVPVIPYTTSTIHHYEKIITTQNSIDLQGQTITITIDKDTYDSLIGTTTTRSFPNNGTITQTIDKRAVSIYDYETSINEEKRKISIMRDSYVSQAENEFERLMSA